jgi:hypothetical protein
MKWKRKSSLVVCAFAMFFLVAALLLGRSRPVEGTAIGISTLSDGCVGYFFSITNRSNRPLQVRLGRNEAPPAVSGVATIVRTIIPPQSEWNVALYPPDAPVPWSATLEYFPEPGPLMRRLRAMAASMHFRLRDSQWVTAQTIPIEER